ncbi:hypothetical protein [Acetobacter nitrogenifigens]|uniref:hypothetical protein n=1 Tax=Acetobacter nitrogenifigens TaxID=285268 RepID=UPI0004121FAE|nr:hypothetical protein [Acetobacter nitrogenifigens]
MTPLKTRIGTPDEKEVTSWTGPHLFRRFPPSLQLKNSNPPSGRSGADDVLTLTQVVTLAPIDGGHEIMTKDVLQILCPKHIPEWEN